MRTLTRIATIAAAGFFAAGAALAQTGWDNELTGDVETPIYVTEAVIGEDLAQRAELIGPDDLQTLLAKLQEDVTESLADEGVLAESEEDAGASVRLVLADARPNHPTFWQLSGRGVFGGETGRIDKVRRSVNLSIQSTQLGRSHVMAYFYDADGQALGHVSYEFESFNLENAASKGVWSDARRGIQIFANRLPEKINASGSGS